MVELQLADRWERLSGVKGVKHGQAEVTAHDCAFLLDTGQHRVGVEAKKAFKVRLNTYGQRLPVWRPKRVKYVDALVVTVGQNPVAAVPIMKDLCVFYVFPKDAPVVNKQLGTADHLETPKLVPKKCSEEDNHGVSQMQATFNILDFFFKEIKSFCNILYVPPAFAFSFGLRCTRFDGFFLFFCCLSSIGHDLAWIVQLFGFRKRCLHDLTEKPMREQKRCPNKIGPRVFFSVWSTFFWTTVAAINLSHTLKELVVKVKSRQLSLR